MESQATHVHINISASYFHNSFYFVLASRTLRILPARVSPVSFVVHRDYIHGDVILLMWVQTHNFDAHGGEHPPEWETKYIICVRFEALAHCYGIKCNIYLRVQLYHFLRFQFLFFFDQAVLVYFETQQSSV